MSDSSLYSTKTKTTKNQQAIKHLLVKPIISVKEARKLLGAEYKNESDEWVMQVVGSMHISAENLIKAMGGSTKCNGGV